MVKNRGDRKVCRFSASESTNGCVQGGKTVIMKNCQKKGGRKKKRQHRLQYFSLLRQQPRRMTTTPGEGVFASSLLVRMVSRTISMDNWRYVGTSASGVMPVPPVRRPPRTPRPVLSTMADPESPFADLTFDRRSRLTAHSSEGDPVLTEEGRVSLNPAVTG